MTSPFIAALLVLTLVAATEATPRGSPPIEPPTPIVNDHIDVDLGNVDEERYLQEQYDFTQPITEQQYRNYPLFEPDYRVDPFAPDPENQIEPHYDLIPPEAGPIAI